MANLVGKTLLGRYHVQESLGRGGMAEVYKVWDSHRKDHLAMKVLLEGLSTDIIFMHRFEREAQTLKGLQHKSIIRFYGLEKEGRLAFMLTDFIEGSTLKGIIFDAGGALPLSQVSAIMNPVCAALSFAHHEGFVHCDIKSENIMLNKYGEALLMDFGIARMSDSATATMQGIGTPAYMAPEQIRLEELTPQSDIYSLGIVLYEMLTGGGRPFTGDHAQITGGTSEKIRWEHTHLPPPSPRSWNRNISVALEKIILRCLEKNPQDRYPNAIDLYNALELAIAGEKPERPRAEHVSAVPTPPLPKPPVVKTPPPPVPHVDTSHPLAKQNPVTPPVILPKRHQLPQISLPDFAPLQKKMTALGQSFVQKVKNLGASFWLTRVLPITIFIAVIFGLIVLLSPAASTLYFASDRSGNIEVYALHDGTPLKVTTSPVGSLSMGAAPALNGMYFTSNRSGKHEIYFLDNHGKIVQVTHSPAESVSSDAVLSPSGLLYFTSNRSGDIDIYYSAQNGAIIQVTETPGAAISWDIAFSPTGLLYFTSDRSGKAEIYYMSKEGKIIQVTNTAGDAESWDAAFSLTGTLYFTSDRSGTDEIYYVRDGGKVVQVTHSPAGSSSWGAALDNAGTLYFTSDRSGKSELYLFREDLGVQQVTHTTGSAESWDATISIH